jgi:alkylation response protein AidB-like acyl-CoA dehydrogenase
LALNAMTSGAEDQNVRLSAAKYAVGVYGQQVAQECIQLHGGIGMTWELDVSHYAKRLLMLDHYFDNADQSLSQVMAAI